jgi:hypothetical protein
LAKRIIWRKKENVNVTMIRNREGEGVQVEIGGET